MGADCGVGLERWLNVNAAWRETPGDGEEGPAAAPAPDVPNSDSDASAGPNAGPGGAAGDEAGGHSPTDFGALHKKKWAQMNPNDFDAIFGVVWNDDDLPASTPFPIPLPLVVETCVMKWEEEDD